jgi:hypothetical protein
MEIVIGIDIGQKRELSALCVAETQTRGIGKQVQLGKADLVSRLQTLLQTGRLHLPRTPGAETLARELLEYEIKVAEDANESYGAFRVGALDDLVTALGLAVQSDPIGPGIY